MNSKAPLNFPPGNFVLSDDAQIERVLVRLGLLQIMSDPTDRSGVPTTRSLNYEGHSIASELAPCAYPHAGTVALYGRVKP